MYIDGNLEGPFGERRKVSGMPTLLFTVSSVIKEIERCVTMDVKVPGDLVYVLGKTGNELGGGEYYQMMDHTGLNVPRVDAKECLPLYLRFHEAVQQDLISSAHAITRGGLAIHLALSAMAGETGMDIRLADLPSDQVLPDSVLLYSESAGRFVVTVDPSRRDAFEKIFAGMAIGLIGTVTGSPLFRICGGNGSAIIEEDVPLLKECWKKPFGGLI
jgi:phosphoribosylformylglycinamidine synthase